jgi:hypothetical protein
MPRPEPPTQEQPPASRSPEKTLGHVHRSDVACLRAEGRSTHGSIEKRTRNGQVPWYMRYRRGRVAHQPVVLHGDREGERHDPAQVRRLDCGHEPLGVHLAVGPSLLR